MIGLALYSTLPERRARSQRQLPVLHHILHYQGGDQPLDTGQCRQAVIVQLLEGGQVAGDDVEQVVGIAEQPLCLNHLRHVRQRGLEGLDGVVIAVAQGDEDDGGEIQPEVHRVETGVIALDGAGLLQRPDPAVAGGDAESDPLCQLGDGKAPVGLELGKNPAINLVHVENFPKNGNAATRN